MSKISLRIRSFVAALLVLVVFIPTTIITLETAFTNSLSQSMLDQLRIQSLTLISEFEMEDGSAVMPEQLFNDQLNIPGSGVYAFVEINRQVVWRSLSTLNQTIKDNKFVPPAIGSETFETAFQLEKPYFLFSYTAEFSDSEQYIPVSFYILQDRATFEAEQQAFENTLWQWLGIISLILIALLLFSLNTALHPISKLIEQIKRAEQGEVHRIEQQYPQELEKLKANINHLLDTERQQRTRYKNSLSDLAHSLKTPLAVLSSDDQMPEHAREPISQIELIINRQLKRAVAGGSSGWEQAIEIEDVLSRLINAMNKVYREKNLSIETNFQPNKGFRGDETDLMELLGNILDNACKAADNTVVVSVSQQETQLSICIDDDGPGIPDEARTDMLARGKRLDSYTEGQGIGMAVVSDLVAAYQGQIAIGDSSLGGARIMITFPVVTD